MGELARGTIADRPWGRTLAALGLRGVTGQLALISDGKRFVIGFEHGAVVAATSPLTADAAVRVALTGHLVSSSQVPEISRRQAMAPERDEIDVIAELARLGPDHALRLRRRVIAQRAARTFACAQGDFVVSDRSELPVLAGCALDIRAVIYMGARANLPEYRLGEELDHLGSWFKLKPGVDGDLPQFGLTETEQPIIERLRDGGTIEDLEAFAASFVDARTVRAVVYALASYNACELGPPRPRRPEAVARAQTRDLRRSDEVGTAATQPIQTFGRVPTRGPDVSELTPISIARMRPMSEATPTSLPRMRPVSEVTPVSIAHADLPRDTRQELTPISIPRPPSLPRSTRPTPTPAPAGTPISVPTRDAAHGSDPAMRPPEVAPPRAATAPVRPASSPSLRPPRPASNPALRLPDLPASPDDDLALHQDATPKVISPSPSSPVPSEPAIRRAPATRPPPLRRRQAAPTDAPQSHDVKALIAQRLKLLDQGADHFQLLGLATDASTDAVRRAYFALARQLHPDRLAALGIADDGKHAQRLFAQINTGFAVLSDPIRRADYTHILSRGGESAIRAEEARAEQLARRVLEAEEAFRRGELALRRDQPALAVVDLGQAVELNPEEDDYHALLAWAKFVAAPDKQAIAALTRQQLEQASARTPHAVTARFYLGRVERMLGRDQIAAGLFRDVLAAAPGHTEAAAELRVLESRLGDKPSGGGGLFSRKRS